jgi:hypothetical protein
MLKYQGFVKKNFDWAIVGGGRIVPRSLKTKGNKQIFQAKPKNLKKIIYDPFIFAKNSFSKT